MRKPNLLDPSFVYTPSYNTNVAKTFARIRREQRAQKATSRRPSVAALKGHKRK